MRISLSELSAAGVLLKPADAAAIVAEICRQITDGALRGVPSPHVIRLHEDGRLSAEGPVGADRATVAHAAKLLESLLSNGQRSGEYRMPGPLRLVLARAQGTLDLPPYAGLGEFCAALTRFATADLQPAARDLYASWKAATTPSLPATAGEILPAPVESTALTISDVRRARRATGLTLAEVSERSRVPVPLLLELEWGYLHNWPAGFYGRAQLVRYARGAGLDDRLVLQAAWPLLEEATTARGGDVAVLRPATRAFEQVAPVVRDEDIVVDAVPVLREVPFPARPAPRRRRWIATLAIAAAIALAFVPVAFEHDRRPEPAPAIRTAQDHRLPADVRSAPPAAAPISHRASAPPRFTDGPASPSPAIRENVSYSPSFSNVGTATFLREDANGRSALMRADDADGSVLKITRIADDNARNLHARPSPDGTLIAFDSDRDGVRGVYIATARGTDVRRISGEGFAAVPSWSPDGRQLAFVKAEPADPRVWNLWTADIATGDERRLTSDAVGQPWGGSWFPDGRRIAYSHETDVVVLDLATGARRAYPTPIKGRLVRAPAVSPDGRRIIFQVYRDGAWLLDVDGGTMRRVLDDPSAEEYTWSPDGHRVAFHSHRAGGWGVWVAGQ